jgi:hypothetical protein
MVTVLLTWLDEPLPLLATTVNVVVALIVPLMAAVVALDPPLHCQPVGLPLEQLAVNE